jgi:glycosyltransferase involved in cell wall biosynthesis
VNILHYLPTIRLAEGGVVRAVLDVCTLLARRGHGVTLACWDPADAPASWAAPEPKGGSPAILRVDRPGRGGLLGRGAQARLAEAIGRADVVHLHTPWDPANLQIARIARRLGKPYILSVHGMLDDWSMAQKALKKRLFMAAFARRLLNGAAAVHCTAEAEKMQAARWFDGSRAVVVPLVFDLSEFRNLPGPELARGAYPAAAGAEPKVLFLSRLHPKKGAEVLLRAGALLRAGGMPVTLLLAGSGEPEYVEGLKRLASELGLAEHAHFLGLVVGPMKVSLFQAADLFILPTSQENFGFVFPESLACRTPVVTTKGVDIWPELIESGGAVICEATPEAIAEGSRPLLADPVRLRSMGERGRAWVLDALDSERVSARFEAMYARAAG